MAIHENEPNVNTFFLSLYREKWNAYFLAYLSVIKNIDIIRKIVFIHVSGWISLINNSFFWKLNV